MRATAHVSVGIVLGAAFTMVLLTSDACTTTRLSIGASQGASTGARIHLSEYPKTPRPIGEETRNTAPEPACDLLAGMKELAAGEHVSLERLTGRYGWDVTRVAVLAKSIGTRHQIPPEVLISIAWHESRWNPSAVGDKGRSCGLTQVRCDFKGRPSCAHLLHPHNAMEWTAHRLVQLRERCKGELCIRRYNGGGRGALLYEVEIWRTAERLRRRTIWTQQQKRGSTATPSTTANMREPG